MIHISVPDTQSLVEKANGFTKYTAYNIYVNGAFHAAVRFSRLLEFSEAIKQRFTTKMHHELRFPSKQWLPLDKKDIEERRIKISKYFNLLVQSPHIVRSLFVEKRFLEFQIESYPQVSSNISFNVHLGDGQMVFIKCSLSLCTDDVMKKICDQLQITNHERFLQMFGLFLARPRDDSTDNVDGQFNIIVVRLLRNFESPYATLQTANQRSATDGVYHKLVIRKMIWDPRVEESLLNDAAFMDLLYRQAKTDLQNGIFPIESESIAERLCILEAKGDKLQYLRVCHQLPNYSYEVFPRCLGDYPAPNTPCKIMIGRRQLVLEIMEKEVRHCVFRATRIHVWKICEPTSPADPMMFQFEYLVDKDSFEWITLFTDHAILISMLIHSMGAEILQERSATMSKSSNDHLRAIISNDIHSNRPYDAVEVDVPHFKSSNDDSSYSPNVVNRLRSYIKVPQSDVVALVSNDRSDVSDELDPLGVCHHNDVFTTITDVLSLYEEVPDVLTDDDL